MLLTDRSLAAPCAMRSRIQAPGLRSHIVVCSMSHTHSWEVSHMATNLDLDDTLIDEARRLGDHKTKKAAVTAALREYIQRRRQLEILQYFGKVEYDPDYDYKAARRRRPK